MRSVQIFALVFFAAVCFAETHRNIPGVWITEGSLYYIDGKTHIPTDSMLIIEPGCSIFWDDFASGGDENPIEYWGESGVFTFFVDKSEYYVEYVEEDTLSVILWGDGIINSDPLFADTSFHLSATSPCIDAGAESVYVSIWDTVIYGPNYDFEDDVRPCGVGFDIGADEYDSLKQPGMNRSVINRRR